jgi:hypothetical protein
MPTYAIHKYSTDLRCPRNSVIFTRSKAACLKAIAAPVVFTYPDPDAARNHHHNLTSAYEMPEGWRKPTTKEIAAELFRRRGSIYSPRSDQDIIAERVQRDGWALEPEPVAVSPRKHSDPTN